MSNISPTPALTLTTLHTLATSPNPNISKSATDLIAARCAKSSTLTSSVQADAVSSDPDLRRKAQTALRFLGAWSLRNDVVGDATMPDAPFPSNSGRGGVRAVGQLGVPSGPSSISGGSSLYEFDDHGHHVSNREASTGAWRVAAHRADGGEVRELSEPELRQRRREAMVLQEDGVEVFDGDDADYIPARTAP